MTVALHQLIAPVVGNGRYRLGPGIGGGSFSVVHEGFDLITGEQVAIKLESTKCSLPQLQYEAKLYKNLSKEDGGRVPKLRWHGQEEDYNVMVIDRMGPSLQDLLDSGRSFSVEEVGAIGCQLLDCLEHIHDKQFIHRDIKPANVLMGMGGSPNDVHLVDFGLAKRYRYPKTGQHIEFRSKGTFTGNVLFASKRSHLGIESSRRDDLESLGYLLLYLYSGELPWRLDDEASRMSPSMETETFKQRKLTTTLPSLCKDAPGEIFSYFAYCQTIGFDERPDYEYLTSVLQSLSRR